MNVIKRLGCGFWELFHAFDGTVSWSPFRVRARRVRWEDR